MRTDFQSGIGTFNQVKMIIVKNVHNPFAGGLSFMDQFIIFICDTIDYRLVRNSIFGLYENYSQWQSSGGQPHKQTLLLLVEAVMLAVKVIQSWTADLLRHNKTPSLAHNGSIMFMGQTNLLLALNHIGNFVWAAPAVYIYLYIRTYIHM